MKNTYIFIPARRGSKGVPKKNQILLDHTLAKIPDEYQNKIIVSTDDDFIVEKVRKTYPKCTIHHRSKASASDSAPTKKCVEEVVKDLSLDGDIIMLYLTYPNRRWQDVVKAYRWFIDNKSSSLLCKEPVKSHPFLCMYEKENKGEQVVQHNLYRRQDYPECFKICHMISIFKTSEIKNLNNNLYNKNTDYYKISHTIDVDTQDDLKKFRNQNES